MKKLIYKSFGGLDVLELAEFPVPVPAAQEVLVRVKAAAINPLDWKLREGQLKVLSGWRFPQGQGVEFAGIVERVGSLVTDYVVGDEVFGAGKGCIAEFAIAKLASISKKPRNVSFEAAATIPAVGSTAASLFEKVHIGEGTEVLVNGATGGIGMFVTQMAVNRKAKVTAVVSPKGVSHVERWKVDRVVDYRKVNILDEGHQYDVVIELSDKLSRRRAKPLLKSHSTYVASLPNPSEMLPGFLGNVVSAQKYALLGMNAKSSVLAGLAAEVAAGRIEIVIGQTFALSDFRQAYAQTAEGKFVGKVVFTIDALS
jgi:NADPH:quinone reductase-like Zn-dependent oxidoreductase